MATTSAKFSQNLKKSVRTDSNGKGYVYSARVLKVSSVIQNSLVFLLEISDKVFTFVASHQNSEQKCHSS
jgi:hypothetical protein